WAFCVRVRTLQGGCESTTHYQRERQGCKKRSGFAHRFFRWENGRSGSARKGVNGAPRSGPADAAFGGNGPGVGLRGPPEFVLVGQAGVSPFGQHPAPQEVVQPGEYANAAGEDEHPEKEAPADQDEQAEEERQPDRGEQDG